MISTFLLVFLLQTQPADPDHQGGLPPSPERGAAMDSVHQELARGRHWHASRRLAALYPDGPGGDGELTLLFAKAESGWRNWPGVRRLLEGSLASGEINGVDAWYLLGRALEGQGLWLEADSVYTRILAMGAGPQP